MKKRLKIALAFGCGCFVYSGLGLAQQAAPVLPVLPEVTVTQQKNILLSESLPAGIGQPAVVDVSAASPDIRHLDQLWVEQGHATWDAGNSLGIANGLNVRGFSVTSQGISTLQPARNFLNGHADLVWRFSRDPATVSRAELISGSDATLLGAGNPAASVLYTSKSPEGLEFRKLGAVLGSQGLKRATGDMEWHWGPIQSRMVLALQRGDKGVEQVAEESSVLLLSNRLAVGKGFLRLDLEYDQNTTPFRFGTAYAGGQFWYDQPYVDSRATANRQYRRQALYFDHPLADAMNLSAWWQHGSSSRDERLLGFFDALNSSQLRGYYRLIKEANQQSDFGIKLQGQAHAGATSHDWTMALQYLGLTRDFAGPQNIGGFTLDLANPVFPADLSGLALSPRYAFERYRERGLAFANVARFEAWEARIGLRRSSYQLDSSTSLAQAPVTVSDIFHTTTGLGLARNFGQAQRVWASRTESFLPNRGRFTTGQFLPPGQSRQVELGWSHQQDKQSLSVALFDLRQSNLTAVDPNDPDALIVIGSNHSRGVEVRTDAQALGLRWQLSLTRQQPRVQNPTSPTQGSYLTGSPDAYGSLRVSAPLSLSGSSWASGLQAWSRLQGAASRPGDGKASFRAPGYGVLSVGIESNRNAAGTRWGASIENLADRRYVRALTSAANVWQGPRRSLQVWVDASY